VPARHADAPLSCLEGLIFLLPLGLTLYAACCCSSGKRTLAAKYYKLGAGARHDREHASRLTAVSVSKERST
jgi:hypothetical protein